MECRGTLPGGRGRVRERSRLAARQVRRRHRIRVIRALLTVDTLAWHGGDCGRAHDREPEWITQLALVRAMADVVQGMRGRGCRRPGGCRDACRNGAIRSPMPPSGGDRVGQAAWVQMLPSKLTSILPARQVRRAV